MRRLEPTSEQKDWPRYTSFFLFNSQCNVFLTRFFFVLVVNTQMLKTCEQGFDDEEEEDSDSEVEDKYVSRKESSMQDKSTIFSTNGAGVPLRRRAGYNYPPTWLRSNSQINKSPPAVNIDSMSLHILDYGYGAHALLTVRQVDGERQKKLTLEQQSRAGVLGRITSGVWVKLAEVSVKPDFLSFRTKM